MNEHRAGLVSQAYKHDANSTLRVDEHIAEIGSDGYRVLPGHRSGGSLELKVCEEFAVKLDGSFI